jgi:ankyrin repeat protein
MANPFSQNSIDRAVLDAISMDDAPELCRLLDSGQERLDARLFTGQTLAMRAVWSSPGLACLKALVERGADLRAQDVDGQNILHQVVVNVQRIEMAQEQMAFLLDVILRSAHAGATNPVDASAIIDAKDSDLWTPLMIACHIGQFDAALALINAGADTQLVNDDGESAVYLAARAGHARLIEALAARGAPLSQSSSKCWTPMSIAAAKNQASSIVALLKHGASLDPSCVAQAAHNGALDALTVLLDAGASVEVADVEEPEESPARRAVGSGEAQALRLLLSRGANMNASKRGAMTLPALAAFHGHVECLQVLAEFGADFELTPPGKTTPLDWAREREHFDCVAFLQARTQRLDLSQSIDPVSSSEPSRAATVKPRL